MSETKPSTLTPLEQLTTPTIARLIRELSDAVKASAPFGDPPLDCLIIDMQTGVVKVQHPAAV